MQQEWSYNVEILNLMYFDFNWILDSHEETIKLKEGIILKHKYVNNLKFNNLDNINKQIYGKDVCVMEVSLDPESLGHILAITGSSLSVFKLAQSKMQNRHINIMLPDFLRKIHD